VVVEVQELVNLFLTLAMVEVVVELEEDLVKEVVTPLL